MTRREILAGLPIAASAAAMALAQERPAPVRYPLGLQFFTLTGRDHQVTWDEFSAKMETARKIGYDGIELAGLWGHKPEMIRRRAEELGLGLRSLHMGFDQMLAFMARGEETVVNAQNAAYTPLGIVQVTRVNLPIARDLGCEWGIIAASGLANFASLDSIKRLCDAFNQSNELGKKAGVKVAYHMHATDFEPVAGRMPFEMMLEQTDPSVQYQLDVCWALAGGAQPAELIRKYPTRLVSFHLKDLSKDKKVATPGDGMVDFPAIHAAAAKIENPIFYVERDGLAGKDPVVEATRAYRYLQGVGWGKAA